MYETIEDLVKANDDELSFGGYTVDILKIFARTYIKYLEKQIELHYKHISNSLVGENPSCEIPKGFKMQYSIQGKRDIIDWIKQAFNL